MARFFEQLLRKPGQNQSSIARKMAISPSYVNKLISGEREGIGTELVRRAFEHYEVDPRYFFDEYEGERSFETYLVSRERQTERIRTIEERLAKLEREKERDSEVRKRPRSPNA